MNTRACVGVTLFLVIVAFTLQTVGVVSPMWVWLDTDSWHVGVGLFYRVGCGAQFGGQCDKAGQDVSINFSDGKSNTPSYRFSVWIVFVEILSFSRIR